MGTNYHYVCVNCRVDYDLGACSIEDMFDVSKDISSHFLSAEDRLRKYQRVHALLVEHTGHNASQWCSDVTEVNRKTGALEMDLGLQVATLIQDFGSYLKRSLEDM